MVLVVVLIVVLVLVVVVQEVLFLVLMVVVELVVGRLPSPLSDILAEERARGLVVGMLMFVGGMRMELVIVVMLVAVVVVFMAVLVMGLHITGVEFILVLGLLVTLVLPLARFIFVAFFSLIIALLLAKASLFSSSILAITSLW